MLCGNRSSTGSGAAWDPSILSSSGGIDMHACLDKLSVRWRMIAAIAAAFTLAVPGAALAKTAHHGRFGGVHLSITPDHQALRVGIHSSSHARCGLTITTKRRSLGFGALDLSPAGTGSVSWKVPDNAPSGSWHFDVSCRKGRSEHGATARIILINHGSGHGRMVVNDSVQAGDGAQFASGADTPSAGQAIVNAAASQVGRTYCWDGGSLSGPTHGDGNYRGEAPDCGSASTVGYDCTGLVIYAVYHGTGGRVDIINHSPSQATTVPGQWITSVSALEPGDIVYFGSSRANIEHAAIYAGNGMIWDADTAFWTYPDGVHERTLHSEITGSDPLNFVGAVRVASAASPAPTPTPAPSPTPAPAPTPSPTPSPTPLPAGQFAVMNATGGVFWRSGPDWNDTIATPGTGVYPSTVIQVSCYQSGAADVPGSTDAMWEQASWVSGSGSGSGWINEHFVNDGSAINQPSPGIPACQNTTPAPAPTPTPAPPPPPNEQTWSETVASGGGAHTWTNYADAGGSEGATVGFDQTVQISCRVQGFAVADGNTWWYQIASGPWNNSYYASADSFYNGSPIGTPIQDTGFVDASVAIC
jgi:hypothetical protein